MKKFRNVFPRAKLVMSVVVATMLSGCAGGYISSAKQFDLDSVYLSARRGWITEERTPCAPATKQEVLTKWGEPNKITTTDSSEMWHYNHAELSWTGLYLFLIIPIPLAAPAGHDQLLVEFKDDTIIRIAAKRTILRGAVCGVVGCEYSRIDQALPGRVRASFLDKRSPDPYCSPQVDWLPHRPY